MRKAVKNNLLEIFKTIYEAHEIVKGFIDKKEFDNAQNLLADCQNTAIQIGNLIEESEGEGFVTVSFLEEYCEVLYEAATNLSEESNGYKVQKQLDKRIIKAENSAKNDIKVKLEIVFMPYKASMWDSLESVWKAADEDPDCDAYVVPIPYYDRKPDHSFGEFHYEGGEYPDYVPVVHYEAYNLEQRRPDVIYIHNPYDGNNYVTSVDPRFYSSELKKHTDYLVYVPYYLAYGSIGEGQRYVPVNYYADSIVIQNEGYRKYFDARINNSKFLPLGSPKFDKVINACNCEQTIPEGWEILKNKRVFFYNTTIAEMLTNTQMFIGKMRYVFDTFAQHKNEACLLWRPHPLLESTFVSMCPQYYDEYMELKKWFISSGIGVFDENPDINLSIALSDIYIGDSGSSVASCFAAVGKPIFVLYNLFNTKPDNTNISWIHCVRSHSDMEHPIFNGNILLYSSTASRRYDKAVRLSDNYYVCSISMNDKVYVCPGNAKDIIVFDKKTDCFERRIQVIPKNVDVNAYFRSAISDDRYIYLIPNKHDAVVIYDTVQDKLISVSDKLADVLRCQFYRNDIGFCAVDNILYISSSDENLVWRYNTKNKAAELISFNIPNSKGFVSIRSDGDSLWMASHIGIAVVQWNVKTGALAVYADMPSDIVCRDVYFAQTVPAHAFSDMVFTEKYVYLLPALSNMAVKIEKLTREITKWDTEIEGLCEYVNCYSYSLKKTWLADSDTQGISYMVSAYTGKLYSIDTTSDEAIITEVPIDYDLSLLAEYAKGFRFDQMYSKYCCVESEMNMLEDIITDNIEVNPHDKTKQLEYFSRISNNLDGTCGEKIHKHISLQLLNDM